jgi:predicted regulator of Ras-like GTPase activity (Roadblock/LC7/MglB family)
MVKAFCIVSPDNLIFQSTLDTSIEQMVQRTVTLYEGKISQLTVNTEQGLVIISKIVGDWLLAVLFPTNLSLGIAVVKTKATLLALRDLDLEVVRSMAPMEKPSAVAAPTTTSTAEPVVPTPQVSASPTSTHTAPDPVSTSPQISPSTSSEASITLSSIPQGGDALLAALDKGSQIGSSLFDKFGPYARDVLFLIDGKRDVKTIAFLLGLPEYAIVEVLEFAISKKILERVSEAA